MEYLAPSVILSLITQPNGYQNEPKTIIQLKGLEIEVAVAVKHLEDRHANILHKKFQIPQERQSTKLTEALKGGLVFLKRKYHREKGKDPKETIDVESKDDINTET